MNAKHPCIDCIVRTSCSKFCDEMLSFYARVIRSYAKYSRASLLFQHLKKQDPESANQIENHIGWGGGGSVLMHNNNSKDRYRIHRNGSIYRFKSTDGII